MREAIRGRFFAIMALSLLVLFSGWVLLATGDSAHPLLTGYAAQAPSISFPCPVETNRITAGCMSALYRESCEERGGKYCDHKGFDLAVSVGQPIRAIAAGHAQFKVGSMDGWGCALFVDITHEGGWFSRYLHLNDFAEFSPVRDGNYQCDKTATRVVAEADVQSGDVIGSVGLTGWTTGPHLHFELHYGGDPRDPWQHMCQDATCEPGWCDTDYHDPSAAVSFSESAPPGAPAQSIVPLAAKLEPNTYSFNPSFSVGLDYTLDEYETLFDFARSAAECQENHPLGVNPCVRSLMAAEAGFALSTGTCAEEMEMPEVGFGTYEFCALSPSAFPLVDNSYNVGYRFALVLEDRTAPPAVSGLGHELVSEAGEPSEYKISWNAPAGVEDIKHYKVTSPVGSWDVEDGKTSITITMSSGKVTVTPVDYAENDDNSESIDI